nr:MAG TPA: hypothetical protein [Crassvirales sp.]
MSTKLRGITQLSDFFFFGSYLYWFNPTYMLSQHHSESSH